MNSITKKISAGTIVATLRMLRSARKEVFLVVEGDDDIAILSQVLTLPQANFVSCFGKERLMEVFSCAPAQGLDSGTIFIRDADFDCRNPQSRGDVVLLVTDQYDLEMALLNGRLFGRILAEFMKLRCTSDFVARTFNLLIEAAAIIGAARKVASDDRLGIKFREMSLGFVAPKSMQVNVPEMARYLIARSGMSDVDIKMLIESVQKVRASFSAEELASGKDLLRLLSIALNRHFCCCTATECSEKTLWRMLRIGAVRDDLKLMRLYATLAEQVSKTPFVWNGAALD